MRNLKSFRGTSNVPLPLAENSTMPDSGAPGYVRNASCPAGIRRPSALNEYVESHPTNAAPVIVPAPFAISMPSSRTPVPSKRSDAVAF